MKYISLVFLLLASNSFSSSDEPHPIIDSNYISQYSYNIKNMDLKELQNTRIILKKHLDSKNFENIDSREVRQKKLLKALLEYDDMRIQITNVIDEIIKEYNVNDEIKEILLSFKETFKSIIKDNRPLVKNLRDYKAYDFRLGSAYLAMMSAFHETEDSRRFYSRLVEDKKDDSTSIGKYSKALQSAQININLMKKESEKFEEISDIKNILDKIEKEIYLRN
tara:strand:- start:2571 stop:3236 length:666 start_codon:yes stop_codon:yes gene_type:complete